MDLWHAPGITGGEEWVSSVSSGESLWGSGSRSQGWAAQRRKQCQGRGPGETFQERNLALEGFLVLHRTGVDNEGTPNGNLANQGGPIKVWG